jgi:hypothetical protein
MRHDHAASGIYSAVGFRETGLMSHSLLRGVLCAVAVGTLAGCASGRAEAPAPAPGEAGTSTPTPAAAAPQREGLLSRITGANDDKPNSGPCPTASVLYDASRVVEFNGAEAYRNIAFTAEMRGVRGLCRYYDNEPITMNIEIDMAFGRGPAATSQTKDYRYWVVVTRRDIAPIAREVFSVPVTFPSGADRLAGTQAIGTITIPRANDQIAGGNFEVLVGFEVTPEQLDFNRQGKRFRVDVANQLLPGQ